MPRFSLARICAIGGWGIHLRWDKVECSIADILDTEVDDRDRPRFEAIQELVRHVYQQP